jgi:hypothetical protein
MMGRLACGIAALGSMARIIPGTESAGAAAS